MEKGTLDPILVDAVSDLRLNNIYAAYLMDLNGHKYGTRLFAYFNDSLYVVNEFNPEWYSQKRKEIHLSSLEEVMKKIDF